MSSSPSSVPPPSIRDTDGRLIEDTLEDGVLAPQEALQPLFRAAQDAKAFGLRASAARVLGSLAGRAYDASWEVAERAAFMLLELARDADAPAERASLLRAMGRGFRNAWLMPYVHSRLSDEDESVVIAAVSAAGGLAFPALEETIASTFLDDEIREDARVAAIAALGRMGAASAAKRLVPFMMKSSAEASAALAALTEIRSRVGAAAALQVLRADPPRPVLLSAVRYLAEIGVPEVQQTLRVLAREDDPELRLAASIATRALEAEAKRDPDERILAALTERDRAVRSSLARRLRTLPVQSVVEQVEVLFGDDPLGVIQIVAEVRAPEVTKLLLKFAADESLHVDVRARAAGSIEANEEWERDALVQLATSKSNPPPVRVAATQTLGAFVPPVFVLDRLADDLSDDRSPAVRGALLWALQLSARPLELEGKERTRCEALIKTALEDEDIPVRRRAAYVAGNLDAAALVPDLLQLAREETGRPDLRIAAFVALGDIASPARFADLVHLWNREDDAQAIGAASRAIERSLAHSDGTDDGGLPASTSPRRSKPPPSLTSSLSSTPDSSLAPTSASAPPRSAPPSLARVHDRLPKLLASDDARIRAATARVAGLTLSASEAHLLENMIDDASPRVREKAVVALGRVAGSTAETSLLDALDDADAAVQERAAEALIGIDTPTAASRVLDYVTRTPDRAAALRIARRLGPRRDDEQQISKLSAALATVDHDDPIYEALLGLKLAALEALRPSSPTTAASAKGIDEAITQLFPKWPRLSAVRGFAPLGKSLRTAEMLYSAADQSAKGSETDLSAAIVLWMKCLEGYMHAWLAPKLRHLQERTGTLWELTDRLLGSSWPSYQRYVHERWPDPVKVGRVSVEVPLRSAVNALRDLQEKRRSFDSPLSVTEWSRILLFLGVDHPTGPRNVLDIACRDPDKAVRLLHRLQVLAQVRNLVTHRSTADAETLGEFRRAYYSAFEDLTNMA